MHSWKSNEQQNAEAAAGDQVNRSNRRDKRSDKFKRLRREDYNEYNGVFISGKYHGGGFAKYDGKENRHLDTGNGKCFNCAERRISTTKRQRDTITTANGGMNGSS